MDLILELEKLNSQNEHDLEHDLKNTVLFSSPKIYTANGDLSKRWYVYFSFRNPETGKLKRMKNIYGKTNRYRTKEKRLALLTSYRRNLLLLLKEGFNPYLDNTELYNKRNQSASNNNKINKKINEPKTIDVEATTENIKNVVDKNGNAKKEKTNSLKIGDAFDFALSLKSKEVSENTIGGYRRKANAFSKWLSKNKSTKKYLSEIEKKDVLHFLNSILLNTSARNRNNYRVDLSSVFQVLKNNELIKENFVKSIPKLKTIPEKNKSYTASKQKEIFTYLEEKDPTLLLFIKFISYNFLRPIEVCRLKVKDINVKEKTIQFQAKNSKFKTKIIPTILLNDLPDLSTTNKELLLFTPNGIANEWNAKETNRRDYFSKRFKNVVKDKFNLGANYGLYSFRHTFIGKLYRKLRETKSPHEAKSDLMLITGHKSMNALESYLREIDAELPKDYSSLFK